MAENKFGGSTKPLRINEMDGLLNYLRTIDWTEPWFMGLLAFHIICAILTIITRKSGALQSIYFAVLMILVLCAEYINEWAAHNWSLFAHQQYFDSNGLFISIVFSVPLLINCLFIVVSWLWDVGVLISNVKEIKIRQARKRKEKQEAEIQEGTSSNTPEIPEEERKKDK